MNLLCWACVIALGCLSVPASAQIMQLPPAKDWAGRTVPGVSAALADKSGVAIDATNPLPVATRVEAFQLATANTAAPPVALVGGSYIWAQGCTGYGSVALRYRGPDGATMVTMVTKTAADSAGGTLVQLGGGAIVDVALSGTTGCSVSLTRVPQ